MLSCKKFCFGNMFSNTYLLWDEESREALIVDSGNEAEPILRYASEAGLVVKWVVLTHAHYDHVLYMDEYRVAFPEAKLAIGAQDAPLLSDIEGNVSYLFGDSRAFGEADEKLCDGEVIRLGKSELAVISTPGHTPGCICLYSRADKLMVTGDTLFGGGGIGVLVGAVVGGVIGTFINPGAGTVLGYKIGAAVGTFFGALFGGIFG